MFRLPFGRHPGMQILMELQHPNPVRRRQAINFVGNVQNPRRFPQAMRALEMVKRNDPDPQLRSLAQYYLAQIQQIMSSPGYIPVSAQLQEPNWNCEFCGTKNINGDACPNCAAPSP